MTCDHSIRVRRLNLNYWKTQCSSTLNPNSRAPSQYPYYSTVMILLSYLHTCVNLDDLYFRACDYKQSFILFQRTHVCSPTWILWPRPTARPRCRPLTGCLPCSGTVPSLQPVTTSVPGLRPNCWNLLTTGEQSRFDINKQEIFPNVTIELFGFTARQQRNAISRESPVWRL